MKTCYVSMPFGNAYFDRLYDEVVKPAVEQAGFSCLRADEMQKGVVSQRSILSAILQSEAMIADVSTGNPSVLYELGARHALRRSRTLVLLRQGDRLPASISYARAILYELGADGRVQAAEEIRSRIVTSLRQTGPMTTDSPIFQFFPDLKVGLPEEEATRSFRGKGSPPPVRSRGEGGTTRSAVPLAFNVEGPPESGRSIDPVSFLNTLKAHRDASAWDSLIREAEEAPPEMASAPEVVHLLTLALNRRGNSGDQDRAIELLEKTVAEIGGGTETLGILGKIYKDRYAAQGDRHDLEHAIDAFRRAFERQTTNFYAGVSLVSLLYEAVVQGEDSFRGDLEKYLPRVRAVVGEKMRSGSPDYFETAAGLHLACLAHDWNGAEKLAELALEAAPSVWMIESTVRELEELSKLLGAAQQENLRKVIETLRLGVAQTLGAKVPYA